MKGNARAQLRTAPRIQAASLVYSGSYEGMGSAYSALMGWIQRHGYRAAGPNREIFLQGPGQGIQPARYVTEVQVPAQPARVARVRTGEGLQMEATIVTRSAFTVVGIPFKGMISAGPYEDGANNNEIGKAWDVFNARAAEVKHRSGAAIGLCFGMPNHEEPWYIAGAEVLRADDLPAGMIAREVPAQKYAVFECTLPTLSETYRRIVEEWQPASGRERGDGPDFEMYDEEWDMNDAVNSPLRIYWPIK